MKFRVTMKDPDSLHDACEDAAREALEAVAGLSDGERALLLESRATGLRQLADRFFEHGEYVTIEIDTDTKEARVVPRMELA